MKYVATITIEVEDLDLPEGGNKVGMSIDPPDKANKASQVAVIMMEHFSRTSKIFNEEMARLSKEVRAT